MIKNSIVAKLWLTIVGMVFLVLALLSVLLQQFFDNYEIQRDAARLTRLAYSVRSILSNQNPQNAVGIIQQMAGSVQQASVDISVPLTQKQQLLDAYQSFTPAQKQAFLSGQTVTARSDVSGADEISVFLIVPNSSGTPGMIDVSQKMSILDQPARQMRNLIIFDTVLAIVLATGLAFVVSKNLSRPLIEMNRVAENMAKGRFSERVAVMTTDEVGRLGYTFNSLASELARTIEQLSIERDQLSNILSSLEDGVVATDMDAKVTLANPPALRRLRTMSVAERGIAEMDQLPSGLMELFYHVTDFKQSVVREESWQGRHMVITMLPLYAVDGEQLRGTLLVLRDITEERRLDRLRKDFIANVSHELRTPLSMMQGYAEALLDSIPDDPDMRVELTQIIHEETLRMKRLVNDLLNLAQLESGQFQMLLEQVDLLALLRRVGRKFQALAQDADVTFCVETPDVHVSLHADADRIEQVFTNLLDNAFRHTPMGTVTFSTVIRNRHAYIRVMDTGAGIPAEDLPFIFERFYKADKSRVRSSSGTGLGLAIARHIILEHNGDILVDSKLGHGTTFTVILPIETPLEPLEQGVDTL